MENQKRVVLLLVENLAEEFVVQCPTNINVQEGDLVEAGIDDAVVSGKVTKVLYTNVGSSEHAIIEKICGGLPDTLRRVYRQVWEDDHNEDQDSD